MQIDAEKTAMIFKALCDKNRVAIVQLLQNGEKCACHIGNTLGLAQSKLSYHMRILCDSGLVECWYAGKWTHYQISKEGSTAAVELLRTITSVEEDGQGNGCPQEAI